MTDSELIDYETSGLELIPREKEVFITSENKCKIYTYKKYKIAVFPEDQIRNNFIQMYLAHYALYIKSKLESDDSFVYLEFKNDQHIAIATLVPKNYHSCLHIINDKEKFMDTYPKLAYKCDKFTQQDHIVNLMVRVSQMNLVGAHNINIFQLYSKVIIRQELYDGRKIHLTPLQRDLLLAPENKITFYYHLDNWEPLILEDELRNSLITQCAYNLLKSNRIKDEIFSLYFRTGDRGLIDLANRVPVEYEYFKSNSLKDFSKDKFYPELKSYYEEHCNGEKIIIVVYFYKPNSEEIFLFTWIPMNKKNILEIGNKISTKSSK